MSDQIEMLKQMLSVWGVWKQNGETWPNRLGYSSTTPVGLILANNQDDDSSLTKRKEKPKRKRRVFEKDDEYKIQPLPHDTKQSRVKRNQSKDPEKFKVSPEIDLLNKRINRMRWHHKELLHKTYVKGLNSREIGAMKGTTHTAVLQDLSDAVNVLAGKMFKSTSKFPGSGQAYLTSA